MNEKRELLVAALSLSESQPGNYALILEETETRRRIPIIIGAAEAQAIAVAMEQMQPLRPLTHDLFKSTLEGLGATLQEVMIHAMTDGIFYSEIKLLRPGGEILALDARPSDAIALAVRMQAPIYTYEHVIGEVAIWVETLQTRLKKGSLAAYTLEELEELLQKVIAKEDFESALRIRDYIEKRRGE
ncbi:MAG: bifunctional nuclease family protein [Bacteroidetes bacterium]|nr:MAG: bifunctional nuclease family protein [Bacteroidota bacterium]